MKRIDRFLTRAALTCASSEAKPGVLAGARSFP